MAAVPGTEMVAAQLTSDREARLSLIARWLLEEAEEGEQVPVPEATEASRTEPRVRPVREEAAEERSLPVEQQVRQMGQVPQVSWDLAETEETITTSEAAAEAATTEAVAAARVTW